MNSESRYFRKTVVYNAFEAFVEVTDVYPSPFGGSVFLGMILGERKKISFRAPYNILVDIPNAGEYWQIEGEEFHTKEYGRTVNVKSAFIRPIPSAQVVGRLLNSHPAFRGFYLGPSKIKDLIKEIGEFALVDLLNKGNYLALSDVIREPVAKALCSAWGNLKDKTELATFLVEHNFDSLLASRLMKLCKHNVVERLKANPYSLISLIDTKLSAFSLVEDLGIKMRVPADDVRRLSAAVEFVLYRALEKGHTMQDMESIDEEIQKLKLKGLPDSKTCIEAALSARAVCVFQEKDSIYIQATGPAYIEKSLENHLSELATTPLQLSMYAPTEEEAHGAISTYNTKIKQTEGFAMTEGQQSAVKMALYNRLSIITGFGGTGKTTIIKAIVELAESAERTVYVCALAGKAKERAREAIDRETFTIHGLIRELKKAESKIISKESDPLIIIDESSMVDISLANILFRAFGKNPFSLLMIGDTAQLPPVGFGVFWHELAKSEGMKCSHLTQVHRQASGSPLHNAAMAIRGGFTQKLSIWKGEEEGVFLLPTVKDSKIDTLTNIVKDTGAKVLTPFQSHRFTNSTYNLNKLLQSSVNSRVSEFQIGGTPLKENDPVIATKNSYELGLFNGMTGVVIDISLPQKGDKETSEPVVCFQFEGLDEEIKLTKKQCFEVGIELGYSLTVHKSQGSEYQTCVVIPQGMERSMLYTALTRPKKLCIIMGTQKEYDTASQRPARIETLKYGFRYQA